MANLPEGLLNAVKAYLKITWQDEATDAEINGYINRGMARLQQIAGAPLDFTEEGQPRALLLDYCRYARSQALEVFEKNFEAELLDLHFSTQAPVIDALTVIASPDQFGGCAITVTPKADEGNNYVCKVGTNLELPKRLEICFPENEWTLQDGKWAFWDGSNIPAEAGQQIMIVEVNDEYGAERAGMVTV